MDAAKYSPVTNSISTRALFITDNTADEIRTNGRRLKAKRQRVIADGGSRIQSHNRRFVSQCVRVKTHARNEGYMRNWDELTTTRNDMVISGDTRTCGN